MEGGSTITQQTAKLLLTRQAPRRRRGFGAKVQEGVLALRLEHRYTKREVLALYLNLAGYGNQIVGAERASRQYFGRDASLVTPAQAARGSATSIARRSAIRAGSRVPRQSFIR